jgi:hypothetical protein
MGQIFKMAFGALALAFCGWMAVFYGSALFLADFHGDWRGVAFAAIFAVMPAWLAWPAIRRYFSGFPA